MNDPTDHSHPQAATPPSARPTPVDTPAAPRRRFHAAVVAVAAGGGLAACQTPPGVPSARAAAAGGDWLDSVRLEHQTVDRLFDQVLASGDPKARALLLARLSDMLTVHSVQEETVLYPALVLSGLKVEPQQLYAEQAQMKVLLAELEVLPKDHPAWPTRVQNLRGIVQRHVQDEETKVYPAFRSQLNTEQNALVTARYRAAGEKYNPNA